VLLECAEEAQSKAEENHPLIGAAEEMLSAIAMKDSVRLAKALEKVRARAEENEEE
jgi:hypothetical protein